MSRKVGDFVAKEFDGIMEESREYRAFQLGMANGIYQLYKYFKTDFGKEKANEAFKTFFYGTDNVCAYFRKMIELSEESNTETDSL